MILVPYAGVPGKLPLENYISQLGEEKKKKSLEIIDQFKHLHKQIQPERGNHLPEITKLISARAGIKPHPRYRSVFYSRA